MHKVKVKICGITNWSDAKCAIGAGADLLGFNFYSGSPRYIQPARARRIVRRLPKKIRSVGVFVNESEQRILEIAGSVGLACLQLHGDETPSMVARLKKALPVIKAIRARKSFHTADLSQFRRANAMLLDGFDKRARGGTGKTFDWKIARRAKSYGRIFLAGGLTPENVADAIRIVQPFAVDVCTGVEAKPGKKNPAKIKALMAQVKAAERAGKKR